MSTKDHQSEPIESASETLQRIFDGHGSVLGSQMADESSRYDVLKKTDFPKPQRTLFLVGYDGYPPISRKFCMPGILTLRVAIFTRYLSLNTRV